MAYTVKAIGGFTKSNSTVTLEVWFQVHFLSYVFVRAMEQCENTMGPGSEKGCFGWYL